MFAPLMRKADSCAPNRGPVRRKCACANRARGLETCDNAGFEKTGRSRQLMIGPASDPLENEADRVAERVAGPVRFDFTNVPLGIGRRAAGTADRREEAPASVERVLAGFGDRLDPLLRRDMESRFGHDFSRVRIHRDSAAEESARDVQALAYTVGNDIAFAAGQFAPATAAGRRLLAHELTHVVQQTGETRLQRQPSQTGGPGEGLKTVTTYGPGSTIAPPPDTVEAIDVRAVHVRRQDWAPVYHLFIVFKNLAGKETYYRGMAGGQCAGVSTGKWGTISTQQGDYVSGSPDWEPGADSLRVMSGSSCRGKDACFTSALNAITAACIPYSPLGPNSNTVVRLLLGNCGVPQLKPVALAPGWE